MESVSKSNETQNIVHSWTPCERDEWITYALNSESEKEVREGYLFNSMLKQNEAMNENEDPRRTFATSCLAKTLYGNHPIIKRLSLCFYKSLMGKIEMNSFLKLMHRRRNFVVMVKGSNAYKMLLRHVPHDIEYSDLDIIIFINPHLDDALFEQLKTSLIILVSQVLSRYKKDLDATLFVPEENSEESILRRNFVRDFKSSYKSRLHEYSEENCRILSPFENNRVRNYCSKKSFVIMNSDVKEDHVVRIEVPHLNKCEFIPLRKTAFVLSHNKTIEFKRDVEGQYIAKFDLIRLRMNNMFVPSSDNVEDNNSDALSSHDFNNEDIEQNHNQEERYDFKKCRVVPADFIDVSIPSKDDAELLDFWNSEGYRRCYEIYDRFLGANIMIPNVNECIRDLSNILNVYTNSHMKMEKRQKRLEMFKLLDDNRKKLRELENVKEHDTKM
jgi:hypothetical protein